MSAPEGVTALVLAGGESRRFGSDKLAAPLRGTSVLDHLMTSLPTHWAVLVVGPRRATARTVHWTREDPPGGGPLAGVAAGVAAASTDVVAVVAGDMPDAGPALVTLVAALRAAPHEVAGVVATDEAGIANPLLAAYRTRAVLAGLRHPAHGRPAKLLLRLPHREIAVHGREGRDVDTRDDLEQLDRPEEPLQPPGGHVGAP